VSRLVDRIELNQFPDGTSIEELHTTRCRVVPSATGVYIVLRDATAKPIFLPKSEAGWFKGQDPSYPLDVLEANWVEGARIVYVGKAAGRRGLRQRLRQLVDFGYGKPVGHRGGRLLWHMPDWQGLVVRWRACQEADLLERRLIEEFRAAHGKRPFANLSK
jgi:hypothetical protein